LMWRLRSDGVLSFREFRHTRAGAGGCLSVRDQPDRLGGPGTPTPGGLRRAGAHASQEGAGGRACRLPFCCGGDPL
jgi:hypothetical protein